ncbi:MAG: nucleoside triphosphate pyrophosphohydrolase [Gammaproteobacteria bacterium]|jgi:ATP diphosphatase
MDKLLRIMALLRDKEHGCPWDLEQTLTSLTRYTLEEVYEVVDAVEEGDTASLKDELGDLLFQVVFYARIAEEDSLFSFQDIVDAISDKLVRRHPHVFPAGKVESFGQQQALDADQVVTNWEAIKKQERAQKGQADQQPVSVLSDIPQALPALERALKIQKRAARVGFDWQQLAPVLGKVREELAELEAAIAGGENEAIQHETGDLLFAVVNLARHTRVEPENALRECNRRFFRRFSFIEQQLSEENTRIEDAGLEKLDQLWDAAKQKGL